MQHARSKLRTAHLRADEDLVTAAEAALAAAGDAFEACWQPLKLLAIGGRLSELIKAHLPTAEQKQAGAEWNPDTFSPALIAAAAVDAGMTPEEWAEELAKDRGSLAERSELFSLALEVNTASSQDLYRRRSETDDFGRLRALLPS